MIISAFAQQSHITVTGRGRAGSESGIKIMKKMEKVYVIKCHLEHLKTHNRGVLGLYLIAPPVMMSYSSRDHGLKVGRLVAPRNNSQDLLSFACAHGIREISFEIFSFFPSYHATSFPKKRL